MAKELLKANFLGVALPDNPMKPYFPEIADGKIEIIPESAEKLRAAIIKNLRKTVPDNLAPTEGQANTVIF